jgi:hypothetical protein
VGVQHNLELNPEVIFNLYFLTCMRLPGWFAGGTRERKDGLMAIEAGLDKAKPRFPIALLTRQECGGDPLWEDILGVFGERSTLNVKSDENLYCGLAAIGRLYKREGARWELFLRAKGIRRKPNAFSPFQAIVKYAMDKASDVTGKVTMLAAVLDEWAELDQPIDPNDIPQWIRENGGVKEIYKARRERLDPTPNKAAREQSFRELIALGYLFETTLPAELVGLLDGDYAAVVHIDSARKTMSFRAIDPKLKSGWLLNNAQRLLISRLNLTKPTAGSVIDATWEEV